MSLQADLGYFRYQKASSLCDFHEDALNRLASDDRAEAAWSAVQKHLKKKEDRFIVFDAILEALSIARAGKEVPILRSLVAENYAKLQAAAAEVAVYFEGYGNLETDSADEIDRMVHQTIVSSRWAQDFFIKMASLSDAAISLQAPQSRKHGDKKVIFGVMLCDRLHQCTGRPLYEFVSVITDIVMQTEAASLDAVRKAWKRVEKKQQKARNDLEHSIVKLLANRPADDSVP